MNSGSAITRIWTVPGSIDLGGIVPPSVTESMKIFAETKISPAAGGYGRESPAAPGERSLLVRN